ncbi:serine/threonine protein phosphatase [Streptomyces dioscori]|uniref:Serine/threonine protein phosphatase n=1 Tax=Streptomyces dioscori TaxID=2109333 RepID=A0A2P8Q495_9ACTN|nr:SpoIIE family protein phosphatase [Streptomyces dioscori]PSM41045.1 serine/threonine protein phosphatase [Streptomyces dioscori]
MVSLPEQKSTRGPERKSTRGPEQKSTRGVVPAARGCEPFPAVTVDASGIVLSHNAQAAALLARVAVGVALGEAAPAWLTEAHLRRAGGAGEEPPAWAEGRIGAHRVTALAVPGADGAVTWWLVGGNAPASTAREPARERVRAGLLQELSSELLASPDVDRCTAMTAQRAARHLADAAVVVGTGDGRTFPVTRCTADGPVAQQRIALDPGQLPGLEEALQGLPAVSSRWIDPRQVPSWAVPEGFVGGVADIGSVVVVPLPGHGVPTGCLVLLRRRRDAGFTPAEESFAQLFAARAGAALSVARDHTRRARSTEVLTRDLLPPALGRVHGICFSGGYRASVAGELVGGDFYDLYPAGTPEAETVAVLGDVCGKGLEAAVVAGRVRNVLQALLPFAADHTRLLTLLNGALLSSCRTPFVTLVLVTAVRQDARVRLRISSAGHPAPLLVRLTGRVEEVRACGSLIGVFADIEFRTAEVALQPGETCLLYSDGITEARGGPLGDVMFSEERLRAVLAQCAGMPAEAVTERVQMIVAQWVGQGPHDDMAVLAIGAPRDRRPTTVHEPTGGR